MPARSLFAALIAACPALAQGTFTNFETPQTHPIEVVTVGSTEYVLVCNTPDNALEVWTATAAPTRLARVPVGLGPGSVRWHAPTQRAYVCNFDGDSVSIVALSTTATGLSASLVRTSWVGDEPADIAFSPTLPYAMVTLSTQGKIAVVDRNDLVGFRYRVDVDFANSNGQLPNTSFPLAVKEPRAIAWLPSDRMLVLNLKGGEYKPGSPLGGPYDVDLVRTDTPFVPTSTNYVGGLGTTNHAFATTANGGTIVVVGTKAMNERLAGAAVATAPTGFVQSWLSVVSAPPTGNMVVHGEAPAGIPGSGLPSRNLNRDYSTSGPLAEVSPLLGIVQPTDVDLLENAGTVTRIALTGYHSDNVAILTPAAVPGGYTIQRVPFTPIAGYTAVGPRGLAYNGSGSLLFVHGRLDNSLRAVDTLALTATAAAMQDPTPNEIRTGRQFLYSVRFAGTPAAAGRGFVSCASCHVDGRTDGLAWDLSHGNFIPVPFHHNDAVNPAGGFPLGFPFASFPNPKGQMVTQTLQGLVNSQLNEAYQYLATNAPYHWRGDKQDFTDFNEAFVNLQRMPNQPGAGTGEQAAGLTATDMVAFRRFVNTIRHPPNPEQRLERRPSGTLPANPNVLPTAANGFAGALMGRALYHNFRMVGDGRSCVDCHSLPDGSSNTLTLAVLTAPPLQPQPLETAALRNLFAREGRAHAQHVVTNLVKTAPNFYVPEWDQAGTVLVANRGVTHAGQDLLSTNQFLGNLFFNAMPSAPLQGGTSLPDATTQIEAVVAFVRELDTGIAPTVGFAYTADPANPAGNNSTLAFLEGEVGQANIGLGLLGRSANGIAGFWFDPTVNAYRDATAPLGTTVTRATLLSTYAVAGNLLVAQATPLGGERRWAHPNGTPPATTGPAPSSVALRPMAPNTFYAGITDLNGNLNHASSTFLGTTRWRINTLQSLLIPTFVPVARHEPPRRFRVAGSDIRPGAKLFLQIPAGTGPGSFEPLLIEFALFPTSFTAPGGAPVWETEAELDPLMTYVFLCGGPLYPAVAQILLQGPSLQPYPNPLPTPALWNQYKVLVVNEDLTASPFTAPSAPLTIQDGR